MKLAIIGATGNVGSRVTTEALNRGHAVTAIVRDISKLPSHANLKAVAGDVNHEQDLAPKLAGHDAIVSAVAFRTSSPDRLIEAVRNSLVKRYVIVGGAGSLFVAPDKLLLDTPDFPEFVREEASKGKLFLDKLKQVSDLEWTMLSPSALITAGERTGKFRLGQDMLLTSEEGKSWISFEDYAVALLDEIETPKNIRRRFTVGY